MHQHVEPSFATTGGRCPCCGRRRAPRPRRQMQAAGELPLFAWAARHHRPRRPGARLILRHDLRDAAGEPRACLAIPGRRMPLAFPNIAAALAALRAMEAAHAAR